MYCGAWGENSEYTRFSTGLVLPVCMICWAEAKNSFSEDTTALIEQLELKTTTGAVPRNRGRLEHPAGVDGAVHLGVETLHHSTHGVLGAGTFIPVLHPDEEQTLVGRVATGWRR